MLSAPPRPWQREFNACIQCGICGGSCPLGHAMDYTPRRIIHLAREGLLEEVLRSTTPWLCVSCYTCSARCPGGLKITDVLFPALRDAAFAAGVQPPAEVKKGLDNAYRYGNPFGEGPRKRLEWTKGAGVPVPILRDLGRPVDVLWIVECYAAYYPRGQDNARATARILTALGVDYAILGTEEKCAGECARLAEDIVGHSLPGSVMKGGSLRKLRDRISQKA